MKKFKSGFIALGLMFAGMHSANAFLFRPIIEVQHNMSDRYATLALLENKKYRIKFYNVACDNCKTIIVADPEIAKFINIRTTVKKVRSRSNVVHHVIEVNKIYEPINTKLIIKSIDGGFIDEINLDLSTLEACKNPVPILEEDIGIESVIIEDDFEDDVGGIESIIEDHYESEVQLEEDIIEDNYESDYQDNFPGLESSLEEDLVDSIEEDY
jgi:hypothetical protein